MLSLRLIEYENPFFSRSCDLIPMIGLLRETSFFETFQTEAEIEADDELNGTHSLVRFESDWV